MARLARRWLPITVVAAIIAALVVVLAWPQPVAVDIATIDTGPVIVTVDEEGRTRVREIYEVSTPVAGSLMRVDIDVGDAVVAGETEIAVIQPAEPSFVDRRARAELEARVRAATAAVTLAESQVEQASAALEFALAEAERVERLYRRGNVSEAALEEAQRTARQDTAAASAAQATLAVRRFELESAEAALMAPRDETPMPESGDCCIRIQAPADGVVLRLVSESAGVVPEGTTIVEIGDPQAMEIVVEALSTDAVRIRTGAEVRIDGWGGAGILVGQVRRVEPSGFTKVSALGIEEQRVNVLIDFTTESGMGHGYRVETHIIVGEADDVARVPIGALFRTGQGWAVFVAEEGLAVLRAVELGLMNDVSAEVRSGLGPGEQVVLYPGDRVEAGTRLEPRQVE